MKPLYELLLQERDDSSEVARQSEADGSRTDTVDWATFRGQVCGLKRRLEDEPSGPWVLLTEDAYAFAVGAFAAWHAGRHVISPPNRQAGALRALHARAVGVLSDRPDRFDEDACFDPLESTQPTADEKLSPLDPDALALELSTSGTTGGQKPVTKSLRHLVEEVEGLDAIWHERIEGACVFAAASHQHLYGLLFGVLWPLHARSPFERRHFVLPGELVPRMTSAGKCLLASVPTHLRRLVRHGPAASLRDVCQSVFSSGGPLAAETAAEVEALLGAAPIEVLGSTETGGIAWRTQPADAPGSPWTAFDSVQVSRDGDGLLRVRSPYVSVDAGEAGYATGDRICLEGDELASGGRFELLGRADHVVKIGEKRLDLARMASDLRAHPRVDEVALTALERGGELRVAAAVVPSDGGWREIEGDGDRGYLQDLRTAIGATWDPVLHPRIWRIVSEVPTDPQGKVILADLHALFVESDHRVATADRPEVLDEVRDGDLLEQTCRIPPDLPCLSDHFPGAPVVPGVLLLDWAMALAERLVAGELGVEEVESVKFLQPLGPGDTVTISVRRVEPTLIEFEVGRDDKVAARGRVRSRATPWAAS